jgi:hypothetical protein
MGKGRCVATLQTTHLNGRQQRLSQRFTYVNDGAQCASERIQPATLIRIGRSIMNKVDLIPGPAGRPQDAQKGDVMFRKIAIALVAASVLTAPVLAQSTTPSDSKVPPTTPAPTASTAPKAEKAITKHRMVVRHHRHGAKAAKYAKSTKMVKHAKSGAKYGKYTRHMGRARTAPKHVYGKAISAKPAGKPSSAKPAAKPGLD